MSERLIPCSEAVTQLWDYLDHSLAPEDYEKVEKHLSFCRRCCGEMEFARELARFLESSAADEIPEDVRGRLDRLLEDL